MGHVICSWHSTVWITAGMGIVNGRAQSGGISVIGMVPSAVPGRSGGKGKYLTGHLTVMQSRMKNSHELVALSVSASYMP